MAVVAGTVDFTYKAPFNLAPWASAYGTNYKRAMFEWLGSEYERQQEL